MNGYTQIEQKQLIIVKFDSDYALIYCYHIDGAEFSVEMLNFNCLCISLNHLSHIAAANVQFRYFVDAKICTRHATVCAFSGSIGNKIENNQNKRYNFFFFFEFAQ